MPRLILASSSPRRRSLLEEAGYEFLVVPPSDGAEPDGIDGATPSELVAELARLKGEDVARQVADQRSVATAPAVILAADTVADCEGDVLGKPRDEGHARQMLSQLSGREHSVLTGVWLAAVGDPAPDGAPTCEVVETRLAMAPLAEEWLEPYLASGKWRGKAGSFGYQDGLSFVRVLAGSESNVVGLPMERVGALLRERGCFPAASP